MRNVEKQKIKCDFDKSEGEERRLLLGQLPEMKK